jgi:hypothetical protein
MDTHGLIPIIGLLVMLGAFVGVLSGSWLLSVSPEIHQAPVPFLGGRKFGWRKCTARCLSLEGGADGRIEKWNNLRIVIRNRVHIVNARVLWLIEIRLRFGSCKKPPAAVGSLVRSFPVHVTNFVPFDRDQIGRQAGPVARRQRSNLIGPQFELARDDAFRCGQIAAVERFVGHVFVPNLEFGLRSIREIRGIRGQMHFRMTDGQAGNSSPAPRNPVRPRAAKFFSFLIFFLTLFKTFHGKWLTEM